ncbi:hypothetical protein RRG08_057486 [Elysia crispata]|uniref:DAD domain-containing protein n=1 Tax=Elysia crispata TaxID=231223 RepID=A0AAE1CNW3_9GAST|nr:hypothetical protein RRG08_057486 [Elysia crispata]
METKVDEDTFILLTVPGRRKKFRHFSGHRPLVKQLFNGKDNEHDKTKTLTSRRQQPDKPKLPKPATYAETVKKGAAVEPERESEAAADDEMENLQSGWQTVPARRKRRRQEPTAPREVGKSPHDSFRSDYLHSPDEEDTRKETPEPKLTNR